MWKPIEQNRDVYKASFIGETLIPENRANLTDQPLA